MSIPVHPRSKKKPRTLAFEFGDRVRIFKRSDGGVFAIGFGYVLGIAGPTVTVLRPDVVRVRKFILPIELIQLVQPSNPGLIETTHGVHKRWNRQDKQEVVRFE